jgi:hypothetical protein
MLAFYITRGQGPTFLHRTARQSPALATYRRSAKSSATMAVQPGHERAPAAAPILFTRAAQSASCSKSAQ